MITQKELHETFEYKDGNLYWKISKPRVKIGNKFGWKHKKGYILGELNGKEYKIHRLIYIYFNGDDSIGDLFIDHVNSIKDDNHIENLRVVTNKQNQYNKKHCKNNKLGLKGVSFCKLTKKYVSYISINGKNKALGYFEDPLIAFEEYKKASIEYHGEYSYYYGGKNDN